MLIDNVMNLLQTTAKVLNVLYFTKFLDVVRIFCQTLSKNRNSKYFMFFRNANI